ncbi:hypothetical protein [Shewanella sp. 10N.286.48.B5]|nr:hypothetical protein [Shewanella sp. 10N.286.48.B5]
MNNKEQAKAKEQVKAKVKIGLDSGKTKYSSLDLLALLINKQS